jgi:Glycosyl transferases group 1/Glycosyl transferase 4-like domain
MLTILHVPYSYFPSACGGTEVYAAALIRELTESGAAKSEIAIPSSVAGSYQHDGVSVHKFALSTRTDWRMIHDTGDETAARGFGALLDSLKPSLVHFHAYSTGVSVLCLRECQRRHLPAVFTYHTPTTTCARGTLLRWGTEVCDGKMQPMTCGACVLEGLGMPKRVAQCSAWLSPMTQWGAGFLPDRARWQVPASIHSLSVRRKQAVEEWLGGMASVVALCAWAKELLLLNGVESSKLKTVRHGLAQGIPAKSSAPTPRSKPNGPVRLVFLGRLNPTKGLDIIMDALDSIPQAALSLDVYTLAEDNAGTYARGLNERLARDARVRVQEPVPSSDVIRLLQQYDAILVPSQWLETGPLVVLEAFAAGIPVLGSKLGGIAEWVTHEQDGLLVDARDAAAWAGMLERVSSNPEFLNSLRSGIREPRSMKEVASEMMSIYQEAIGKN